MAVKAKHLFQQCVILSPLTFNVFCLSFWFITIAQHLLTPMPISFHCLNHRRFPHISSCHNSPESSTWGISVPTLTWYFQQKKFLSMSFLDETILLLFTVFTTALTHFHRPKCHYSSMLFSPPLSTAGYYLLSCYYSYQHLPSWKVFFCLIFCSCI